MMEAGVRLRYAIRSLPGTMDNDAQRLNGVSRPPWERAHRVPWVLDVAMGEDTNRTRAGESGQHLACIHQLALPLL
jgi:predicted transposase YbfD/YdcC